MNLPPEMKTSNNIFPKVPVSMGGPSMLFIEAVKMGIMR